MRNVHTPQKIVADDVPTDHVDCAVLIFNEIWTNSISASHAESNRNNVIDYCKITGL